MLSDLLIIFLLACIPAAFNHFLNYALGEPMSREPSTKAILSRYSLWMATRRAKQMGLYSELYSSFYGNRDMDFEMPSVADDLKHQFNLSLLLTAQKYFSWEQAFGMCPFCTGFWCSLLASAIFYFTIPFQVINPIILFFTIPFISHSILRKL